MADEYSFTAQQREMLEELLKPDYDDIFLSLIGNYQPDGTPIGPVDISDIQGTLPDDLDPLRESIVLTAYQLLGKVTYFWGGKSLVLGWDSRWGTPTTVTAPGSGSTGKVLPFGLDCSGFVDWTFYNATTVHTCPDAAVAQLRSMATAPTLHGQTRCPAISSFTRTTATSGSSAAMTA